MSEVEELLDEYSGPGSGVYEEHIVINRDRTVTVPDSLKKIGVQYDHNVETLIFDCPRYWDEHDLSTMNIYINYSRSDGLPGTYDATNSVKVDEANNKIFHFEWKISNNVTLSEGRVLFLVCAKDGDEEGNETVRWNSEPNEDTYISKGLDTGKVVETLYPDIINQLLVRMNAVENKFDPSSVMAIEADIRSIKDGTIPVAKATCDADGNVISETYATKDEAATKVEVAEEFGKIADGTTKAAKAIADEDGNNIKTTYATKEELEDTTDGQLRVAIDDIINGTTPAGKAESDKYGRNIYETYATKDEMTAGDADILDRLTNGSHIVSTAYTAWHSYTSDKAEKAVKFDWVYNGYTYERTFQDFYSEYYDFQHDVTAIKYGSTAVPKAINAEKAATADYATSAGSASALEQLYLHTVSFQIVTGDESPSYIEFSVTYVDSIYDVQVKNQHASNWIFYAQAHGSSRINVPVYYRIHLSSIDSTTVRCYTRGVELICKDDGVNMIARLHHGSGESTDYEVATIESIESTSLLIR